MPAYYEWKTVNKKKRRSDYPSFEVSNHPLKPNTVIMKQNASKDFLENLNKWSSAFEVVDPLLQFEHINVEEQLEPEIELETAVNYTKAWSTKRSNILHKYTTGEKLTIVSSFLPGGEKVQAIHLWNALPLEIRCSKSLDSFKQLVRDQYLEALIKQVSNLNEKVKHRLEQLDEFDESSVRKTMGLSQQEFITKINLLNTEMKKAWDTEQRVKAFKIAIQCSKLLMDTSVMQFYPSKFVLITDILDMFGDLVFERLKEKSFGTKSLKNIQYIDSNIVPEQAKETCQNWIYKMASIRELLPRLYMEMALLKCYVFISKNDVKLAIARLTTMIRGIGNSMVAVYLRLYLCRVASKLVTVVNDNYFYDNFKEVLEDYQQIFHPSHMKAYASQSLTLDKYLSVYLPAMDWLLFGTLNSNKCKISLFDEFLQQCQTMENNELLLYCLLTSFDSITVNKQSLKILEMIQQSADEMVMIHEVLASLGEHLCSVDHYQQVPSENLIQIWWKIANKLKSPSYFLQVLEPWLEFACKHLSTQHINVILRGTIRYMIKCEKPADEFSGQFQFVLKRMLNHIPEVEEVFLMDAFMPLVELVQTTSARTMMAKTVLSIFFTRYSSVHIEDHIIIGSLMRLCCILHDSINAVTVEDESKVCAELINKYIQTVRYQDDSEQQLNFYVECRSAFIKLDAVLIALVHAVNTLAVRAEAECARGGWLQRASAAYCFITVPSLHCALNKLQLYLLSGQVALLNKCIGQAEANFKAFVGLIPDIPEYMLEDGQKKPTNIKVGGLINDFLSTLLILPDNLDSNCKVYVLSGFIRTLERIHWRKTDVLYYTTILHTLDLLCNMTQENYSYHIESVLSNDALYGSDYEFIDILEKYSSNLCQELLVVLKALSDSNETKKQSALSLEMFWRVTTRADLNKCSMSALALNLWILNKKLPDSNTRLAKSMLNILEGNNTKCCKELLRKLKEDQ